MVAGKGDGELKARKPRATVWPSALKERSFSAQPKAEDRKLRKELALEVLALKVPFRNLLGVSEFSPVAGTISGRNALKHIDAGRARELQKMRPASHTNALGELFIPEEGGIVQQKVYGEREFTSLVRQ